LSHRPAQSSPGRRDARKSCSSDSAFGRRPAALPILTCGLPEQWPAPVRKEADEFAERLRANGLALPVCHFVEWADIRSMGDLFSRWLTPPNGPKPLAVFADQFEIYAYALPDGASLADYLCAAGPQQFTETD